MICLVFHKMKRKNTEFSHFLYIFMLENCDIIPIRRNVWLITFKKK